MKWGCFTVFYFFVTSLTSVSIAGDINFTRSDSLSHKEIKKLKREKFRKTQSRYFIKLDAVRANLNISVDFELLDGFLNSRIGLEKNLGLPGKSTFFTGSVVHRIAPANGLYAQYYGINRTENYITVDDFTFKTDTIPAGTASLAYFNT